MNHNQILTTNVAVNLYWLGRYLERIESTLLEIEKTYDCIIDVNKKAGTELFEKLGIELKYTKAQEFLQESVFGNHSSNICELLDFVRENAIISRSCIELEAFGSIIQLHTLFKEVKDSKESIDFRFIDEALSLISEIWGELTRRQTRYVHDYFLALGKNVEKVDFHLRLGKNKEYAMIVMDEIDRIVSILAPDATFVPHDVKEDSEIILNSINNKINKIVEQ